MGTVEGFMFDDAFRRLVNAGDALLAGKIDSSTALAHSSCYVAMDRLINTALKVRREQKNIGFSGAVGSVEIFEARNGAVEVVGAQHISDGAFKKLSSVTIDVEPIAKARNPKIGFVGLSPTEAGSISMAYGEYADLLFWKDEGIPKLKPLCNCDVVFVNLSQSSHKTTEYLTANGLPESNLVKVKGGVSAMLFAVKSRFESEAKNS